MEFASVANNCQSDSDDEEAGVQNKIYMQVSRGRDQGTSDINSDQWPPITTHNEWPNWMEQTRAAYIIVSSVDSGDIFFMLSFEEQYIPRS